MELAETIFQIIIMALAVLTGGFAIVAAIHDLAIAVRNGIRKRKNRDTHGS